MPGQAHGNHGEEQRAQAAAQLRGSRDLAVEGAEGDAGDPHARRGVGEGEEECLVDHGDEQEGKKARRSP